MRFGPVAIGYWRGVQGGEQPRERVPSAKHPPHIARSRSSPWRALHGLPCAVWSIHVSVPRRRCCAGRRKHRSNRQACIWVLLPLLLQLLPLEAAQRLPGGRAPLQRLQVRLATHQQAQLPNEQRAHCDERACADCTARQMTRGGRRSPRWSASLSAGPSLLSRRVLSALPACTA